MLNRLQKFACHPLTISVALVWVGVVAYQSNSVELISDFGGFFFMGITGAIFANSTGAGGGVVFIPLFEQLLFTEKESVATSFAIQCFGMTAGALSWMYYAKVFATYQDQAPHRFMEMLARVVIPASMSAVVGLWVVYGTDAKPPGGLHNTFSLFSVVLGLGIIFSVYAASSTETKVKVNSLDLLMCCFIALWGGGITAWLSVGVGEVLAFYLMIRRYSVTLSIAAAVIVSCVTVWGGIVQHLVVDPQIIWPVVLFAGPGAVMGGLVAKYLVLWLSPKRVKLFFGIWVLSVGLVTSPVFDTIA